MMRVCRWIVRFTGAAGVVLGVVAAGAACETVIVLRAYLSPNLWRPARRDLTTLLGRLPPERTSQVTYAGMSAGGASPSLQAARDAYRSLFPDRPPFNWDPHALNWPASEIARVREIVNAVRPATPAERDELALLTCKIELRGAQPLDAPALTSVRSCFDAYLATPRPNDFASEARGWTARVEVLLGHQSRAAKLYLAELAAPGTAIRRERLLASLALIEPSADDLEEYFDTPAHALFIANRITNVRAYDGLAAPLIDGLERHRDLFGRGWDSDTLAVTLMRAATRNGAPAATLRYAAQVRPDAPARASAEYNWLLGAARFQQRDYRGAERALKAAMTAADAGEHRRLAASALVGVYARLHRPVDQLHAAFAVNDNPDYSGPATLDLDASYLLDVELTDAQLEAYLTRFGNTAGIRLSLAPFGGTSSLDAVRYALAVRYARREKYGVAAQVYETLHAKRAPLMREAERLIRAGSAPDTTPEQRLNARYEYAAFLARHENEIFFNDRLWEGFQTGAFVYRNPDTLEPDQAARNRPPLPDAERRRLTQQERQVRDDQEEYWRAYLILKQVVAEAGPTPLGKRAVTLAVSCLRRINQTRFGRSQEIGAADLVLSAWLDRPADVTSGATPQPR